MILFTPFFLENSLEGDKIVDLFLFRIVFFMSSGSYQMYNLALKLSSDPLIANRFILCND